MANSKKNKNNNPIVDKLPELEALANDNLAQLEALAAKTEEKPLEFNPADIANFNGVDYVKKSAIPLPSKLFTLSDEPYVLVQDNRSTCLVWFGELDSQTETIVTLKNARFFAIDGFGVFCNLITKGISYVRGIYEVSCFIPSITVQYTFMAQLSPDIIPSFITAKVKERN